MRARPEASWPRITPLGVALVAVVWLCSGASADEAATLPTALAPRTLGSGAAARVEEEPKRLATCQLRLADGARHPALLSTVRVGGARMVVWTWRVPAHARAAKWSGTIRCWRRAADTGRAAPDRSRRFAIKVLGHKHGVARIASPGTLTVETGEDKADTRPTLARWADWAAIVTAIGALAAIVFGLIPYLFTRRQAKRDESAAIFERLNSKEFLARWSGILAFQRVADEAECLERIRQVDRVPTGNDPLLDGDRWKHAPVTLNDMVAAHNFFEETGLRFNDHVLAQHLVGRGFGEIVSDACFNSWWWLHHRRGGRIGAVVPRRSREVGTLAEWEWMVRQMLARKRGPMIRRMLTRDRAVEIELRAAWRSQTVRAICLPLDAEPSAADWVACGRLSRAVGLLLRRKRGADRLEKVLEQMDPAVKRPSARSRTARATILVPPLPDLLPVPWLPVRLASALGSRWVGLFGGSGTGPGAPGEWLVRRDGWVRACERHQDLALLLELRRRQRRDDVNGLIDAIRAA